VTDKVDTSAGQEWVTVKEAAALLSKSDRTIRRMASDGRLTKRREGARLLVKVPDTLGQESDTVISVSEVESLRAEVDRLRTKVDMLTDERDYLRSALATALQLRQAALEAPRRSWLDRLLRRRE
jgi:excisionase family DNA binding protein